MELLWILLGTAWVGLGVWLVYKILKAEDL